MKTISKALFLAAIALSYAQLSSAQVGTPYIHDPSTIAFCDGKYYTFGTGGGGLVSEDGWTWTSLPREVRPGGGAAPDVIKVGNRFLVIYGATGGGLGGRHNGTILTMWNKTFDMSSANFNYTEAIEVASSNGYEDCDAIDPGVLLDPTTGRMWLSYGTYFGFIRLIELDPKTGMRVEGNVAKNIAIDCEATDLIYNDGWYYLLGTHGTCCDGVNSTYNIVCGRSRSIEGPYIDNVGRDMLAGGGKMVIGAGDRLAGPGHFGRTVIDEGVEIMSCHYEADFDQGGRSVLGLRPLLWKNGWPVAGDRFKADTYEIESVRRGYALELAVDFVRINQERRFWFNHDDNEPVKPIADQPLDSVINTWPEGEIAARIGDYMFRPHQRWAIAPAPDGSGYLGGPYYTIKIEGTERALAATAEGEVTTVPAFTGAPEQLWRIEQLIDGNFRILPKEIPGTGSINTKYCLYSAGDSTPTLAPFDFNSDNSKWNFRKQ